MPEMIKGSCVHCQGNIEFDSEHSDSVAECPHCGKDTVLRKAAEFRQDQKRNRRLIVWSLITLLALCFVIPAIAFRHEIVQAFQLLAGFLGSAMVAFGVVTVAVIFLIWCGLWLLFPVFVYFGFRDLQRKAEAVELATQSCARTLGQIQEQAKEKALS